jgi:hypothetical protein
MAGSGASACPYPGTSDAWMRSGRTAASVDAAVAPPRPPANPVLGSALEQRRSQIRAYERAMHEHGDVVRLVVGPPGLRFELYCVFHPDGVKAVLAGSRAGYSKPTGSMPRSRKAFGSGLLTSEGELWHRQRRLIQPLFTRRQIAKYRQLMSPSAGITRRGMERPSMPTPRWSHWHCGWSDARSSATTRPRPAPCSTRRSRCSTGTRSGARCRRWPRPRHGRPRTTAGPRAPGRRYAVVDELIASRQRAGADGDDLPRMPFPGHAPDREPASGRGSCRTPRRILGTCSAP